MEPYFSKNLTRLVQFIIERKRSGRNDLPSLQELSDQLGMSVPTLREQIEALKVLGVLEARPRHGVHIRPVDLSDGLTKNAIIAAAFDIQYFYQLSQLRDEIETSWFAPAAKLLDEEDIKHLEKIVARAEGKLEGKPIQIPYQEHKELHLSIYKRLDNLFVKGILEAYWTVYESVGMNLYTDLDYQVNVWDFHKAIVHAIKTKAYQEGQTLLVEHMKLLHNR